MRTHKAFKTDTQINGQTKRVIVTIESECDDLMADSMESDLMKETERNLSIGRWSCVWVRVRATFADLGHFEGQDSLGQVIVTDSYSILDCVSEHDMVLNAIDDLKTNVLNGKSQIETFLTKAVS